MKTEEMGQLPFIHNDTRPQQLFLGPSVLQTNGILAKERTEPEDGMSG